MLKRSARNSIDSLSPSLVCLEKLISQLLIPGPQQSERGALPIVPKGTVALVIRLGSKEKPETGWQAGRVGSSCCANGPVKAAHTVLRGFTVLNFAPEAKFGWPGSSKSKVVSSSSTSSCDVMRIGKPLWKERIPVISQPSSSLPLKPSYLGIGKSQT